ncbi:glycoside hydrolase family protein [Lutibacter citreus]|uniref:glycoside hydrolase family protein n=1 Tax=Lutibacter citreus TaxID=2138210 RepID=UPI001300AED2|nr:glycoside hydrolase family protein [Lutibacter citreus]
MKHVKLKIKDVLSKKETAYEASYETENPFRDAMLPVPKTAIFKMKGYSVWCPAIIKVDNVYHMFCSRWADTAFWGTSHIIRATSKSLFGPYEYKETVMKPSTFPHKWGQVGLHNPKIMKIKDKYLLYFLGIPSGHTGYAISDKITGPWEIIDKPVIPINNPAMCISKNGKAYVVGKDNVKENGNVIRKMRAFEADNYMGPFKMLGDTLNRLPYNFQLEDPAIWFNNNQYNIICTDWLGLITSEQKSVVYLTSKDGINYKLYSRQAIWRRTDPIPIIDKKTSAIDTLYIEQVERPEVYLNKKGEVEALMVGVIDRVAKDKKINYIMIRPVDKFVPKNK